MNTKLQEINEIIALCDDMLSYIEERGNIQLNNELYLNYKSKIEPFCERNKINDENYAPYKILCTFYFDCPYCTVNKSEATAIKDTLVKIKHSIFKDDYEQIFISHREKDAKQVEAFINLLHIIGIPYTKQNEESMIFCTSHPEGYIKNGERNLDEIRNMIDTHKHVFYILWYTDKYFESAACMNEVGAIWAMNKKYQEILMPNFDENKIRGLLDKQPVWFKANDKKRLNTFKEQIEKMFDLPPVSQNVWESARDTFIQTIDSLTKEEEK